LPLLLSSADGKILRDLELTKSKIKIISAFATPTNQMISRNLIM
jgi:hypothetical protein